MSEREDSMLNHLDFYVGDKVYYLHYNNGYVSYDDAFPVDREPTYLGLSHQYSLYEGVITNMHVAVEINNEHSIEVNKAKSECEVCMYSEYNSKMTETSKQIVPFKNIFTDKGEAELVLDYINV